MLGWWWNIGGYSIPFPERDVVRFACAKLVGLGEDTSDDCKIPNVFLISIMSGRDVWWMVSSHGGTENLRVSQQTEGRGRLLSKDRGDSSQRHVCTRWRHLEP